MRRFMLRRFMLRRFALRKLTLRRSAVFLAAAVLLTWQPCPASAQSLFNRGVASGQTASSATPSGSLFSNNVGFPRTATPAGTSSTRGGFVGRSNREFVGRTAPGQSGGDDGGVGSRGTFTQRREAFPATGGTSTPESSRSAGNPADRGRRRTPIAPRHRIGFEFDARPTELIEARLRQQFETLSVRAPEFAEMTVQVDGEGRVTLQGRAPTAEARRLAAIMVRLEPGVRRVRNELTVPSGEE